MFRVTRLYLSLLVKPRIFFWFPGKKIIAFFSGKMYSISILKGEMPFKMYKIIFFSRKNNYKKKYKIFRPVTRNSHIFYIMPKYYSKILNLILAFIINIISHLIEHLNVSPAFIVSKNKEMHAVLYITTDVYIAIMNNYQSVACVAQWVEHVNTAVIFKLCVESSNPVCDIYYCKDFFF